MSARKWSTHRTRASRRAGRRRVGADVVRAGRASRTCRCRVVPAPGSNKMTIYVQMPDTLALNVNSRVRVADVFVGSGALDRAEELGRDADAGRRARRQAAGEHAGEDRPDQPAGLASTWSWTAPPDPSPQLLKNGDTIPLKNSIVVPDHRADAGQHRAPSSPAAASRTSKSIQTEVNNILTGAADQIREFLGQARHVHRRAERAARRHHPGDRLDRTGCCRSWRSATTPWTGC